jgi:hypothetical protein
MHRRTIIGLLLGVFILAGCGPSLAEGLPGQWEGGLSEGITTFTTDGWAYNADQNDLACWFLEGDSIIIREPGQAAGADDLKVKVSIDGETMNWTNEGQTVSFKRAGDTNVLPTNARTLMIERGLSDDPKENAKTKCIK